MFSLSANVGAYGGAFKVTDGLIDEFGKERSSTRLSRKARSKARLAARL